MTRYHRDPLFWACLAVVVFAGATLLGLCGPNLIRTAVPPAVTPTIAVTVRPAPTLVTIEAGPATTRAPSPTMTPIPERILTTPTGTPRPPTATPAPPTPTAEPTATPERTKVEKG